VDAVGTTAELLTGSRSGAAAASATSGGVPAAGLWLRSPVTATLPGGCAGGDHRGHARESGFGEDPPAVFFRKNSASVSGPTDDVVWPPSFGPSTTRSSSAWWWAAGGTWDHCHRRRPARLPVSLRSDCRSPYPGVRVPGRLRQNHSCTNEERGHAYRCIRPTTSSRR
jgi:hypothetical protein